MYTPETFDLAMFPRLCSTNGPASDKFNDALFAELAFDEDESDFEKLIYAIHTYWDAMFLGNIEAAVNLLRILMQLNFNSFDRGTNGRKEMEYRTQTVINLLSILEHPIVDYYEALTKFHINGETAEALDLMDALVVEDNEYACALYEYCVEDEDESDE